MTAENTTATGAPQVPTAAPLDDHELGQLRLIRQFGTAGALLVAAGSLGAGAAPVFNPVPDLPVIGVFSRLPTVALACAYTGMGMIVLAWLWMGRFARPRRERMMTRRQVDRTLLMWVLPLVVTPPMFSRDVYSYLAQSKIFALGMDPYKVGPAQALGTADLLTRNVPNVWRDTPAPYGPGFLTAGRAITWITGDHVISAALLHRVIELLGLALIVWALPRLARRFGVSPVSALWLGALNPLVLFHLVAGAHNEALMLGLMLAGFEVALTRMPPVPGPGEPIPPVSRAEIGYFLLGAVVISVGASVKFTALAALGFLGVHAARRLGGSWRTLIEVAVVCVFVGGAILAAISLGSGLGFGWFAAAVNTPGLIKTFLAPITDLGNISGQIGIVLGLGNHTAAAIDILRMLGSVASVLLVVKILHSAFKGRMKPAVGLGLCMAGVVFFGAAVQPWYLLWAAIPLAAGVGDSKFRTWAAAISAIIAMCIGPTGSTFNGRAFVLPEAIAAAVVVLIVLVFLLRKKILIFGLRKPLPASGNR